MSSRVQQTAAILSALALVAVALVVGNSSASTSSNLVADPSFESDLSGWTPPAAGRSLTRVPGGHSGGYAAQLGTTQTATLALTDMPNTVTQTPAAANYNASVWVLTATPKLSVSLKIREVNQSRKLITQKAANVSLTDTNWHQVTLAYTPAKSGDQLDLNVLALNAAPSQTLLVDDVVLTQTVADAPATTSATPTPTTTTSPPAPTVTASPTPTATTTATATPTQPPAPAVSPSPTTTTAPASSGSPAFGAAVWRYGTETWMQAVQREDTTLGAASVIRVYYTGLPSSWPGAAGAVNRSVVVSFKAPPADILSGVDDTILRNWFATAPTGRTIWWSYYHEPEDNIAKGEFTAAQYRAAFAHIVDLSRVNTTADLRSTLILMNWTLDPASGRNWLDYYPGSAYVDVLGWDAYNIKAAPWTTSASQQSYQTPDTVYGRCVSVSKAAGKPFGFGEWGSTVISGDSGSGRAAWITASGRYFRAEGAAFAAYFDTPNDGSFQLADAPSQTAMANLIAGK